MWPDDEIKRSQNFTISSLKSRLSSFYLNRMVSKLAQKVNTFLGNSGEKICHQKLSKISQSGHTGWGCQLLDLSWSDFNVLSTSSSNVKSIAVLMKMLCLHSSRGLKHLWTTNKLSLTHTYSSVLISLALSFSLSLSLYLIKLTEGKIWKVSRSDRWTSKVGLKN